MNISDCFNSPDQAAAFEKLIKGEQTFVIYGPDRGANIQVFSAILADRRYDYDRFVAALEKENFIKPEIKDKQKGKIFIGDCPTKEGIGEMLALFTRRDAYSVSAMWIDKNSFKVFLNCLCAGCKGNLAIWDILNAREGVDKLQEWFGSEENYLVILASHLMFVEVKTTDKGPVILSQHKLGLVDKKLVLQ